MEIADRAHVKAHGKGHAKAHGRSMRKLMAWPFLRSLLRWPVALPFCQGFCSWAGSAPGYTRGVRDTCLNKKSNRTSIKIPNTASLVCGREIMYAEKLARKMH